MVDLKKYTKQCAEKKDLSEACVKEIIITNELNRYGSIKNFLTNVSSEEKSRIVEELNQLFQLTTYSDFSIFDIVNPSSMFEACLMNIDKIKVYRDNDYNLIDGDSSIIFSDRCYGKILNTIEAKGIQHKIQIKDMYLQLAMDSTFKVMSHDFNELLTNMKRVPKLFGKKKAIKENEKILKDYYDSQDLAISFTEFCSKMNSILKFPIM
jgi:hypothetical protein